MSNLRGAKKSRIENQARPAAGPVSSSASWTDAVFPLAIFLLAFGVRLIYLFEIKSIPLFHQLAGDSRGYDEWAQRIAAGNWLGEGVFYQAPLYPYFLGLLQFALGHDLWWIRVVQIALGATSSVLLYWAGSSFFSRGVGIAAGVLTALYGPAIFFDGLIQKAVLDLFLVSLMLFLLSRMKPDPRAARWAAIGAIIGLLGLSRENALVWSLVLPIWIWPHFAADPPRIRLGRIAVFLLGLALILFPVGLRNLMVGGEFTLTTSQLGANFFIGNNPQADGSYMALRVGHGSPQFERQDATELAEQALGRSLSPGEVSHYWLARSGDYLRSQPIDWIRLMGRKWLMVWNVREFEDTDDFYLYQRWSWLLSLLGSVNHFGLLAPLAALGLAFTWSRWRELWLIYILLATFAFSVALFFVLGRYRFPMVPLLALFAGAALMEGYSFLREKRFRQGLMLAAVLLLSVAAVYWPLGGKSRPSAAAMSNLGNAFAKQGNTLEAIRSYETAVKLEPNYAVGHYNMGNLLAQQGRLEEARSPLEEALRLSPEYGEAHNNLGNILFLQGDLKGAIQHFQQALEFNPQSVEIHFNLGNALVRQGQLEEAVEQFKTALKLKPDFPAAHYVWGRILASQGRLSEAIGHFRQALRMAPEYAEAHEGLGRALAEQGKKNEAAEHLQEALRIMKSRSKARITR